MGIKYQVQLNEILGQLMTDEISASTMYIEASGYMTNIPLAKEILAHGAEEYGHFQKLMAFCISHGLKTNYDFDRTVIKKVPKNKKQILKLIQELEQKAIKDYKEASLLARANDDIEAMTLFTEIMNDEIGHFDDLAQETGEVRRLGEGFKNFKSQLVT